MRINYMEWSTAEGLALNLKYTLERLGLEDLAQRGTFLDIGTGDAKLLVKLSRLYPNARFYGLSGDKSAKRNMPKADIRDGLFQRLPFENDLITVAVSNNILDYAEENVDGFKHSTFRLGDLVREVYRVLLPGGIYIPYEFEISDMFSPEDLMVFQEYGFGSLKSPFSFIKVFRKGEP